MFVYSVRKADIFSGIHFFWCYSFTAFKQSKSNISWLNRKIQHKMVKVPFQYKKNWANYKCLVRKNEKMCLPQNFSKTRDVEFQKWHFLCIYAPEFHMYVSIHGNNTLPGCYFSKSVGMYLSHANENWKSTDFHLIFFSQQLGIIEYEVF